MKKIVFTLFFVSFTGSAFGGDVIEMKQGVKFKHKNHQLIIGDCKKCHTKGPGKIENFGREYAHKICKGCHLIMKKGPVECKKCHVGTKNAVKMS